MALWVRAALFVLVVPGTVGGWALGALAFHLAVTLVEEPALARTFGASYDRYRARVPRWIPRAFARRTPSNL